VIGGIAGYELRVAGYELRVTQQSGGEPLWHVLDHPELFLPEVHTAGKSFLTGGSRERFVVY
jgi:hypothetical protein